jgi:hypothetical protein
MAWGEPDNRLQEIHERLRRATEQVEAVRREAAGVAKAIGCLSLESPSMVGEACNEVMRHSMA